MHRVHPALLGLALSLLRGSTAMAALDVGLARLVLAPEPRLRSRDYRNFGSAPNRYRPHQGDREIARRRRQIAAGQLTGLGTGRP